MAAINDFEIVKHNFIGYFNPNECPEKFRPWVRFMNEHSLIKTAITIDVPLRSGPLKIICSTAEVADDLKSFSFTFNDTKYVATESLFNSVLNFPQGNFVPFPSDDELTVFFRNIFYHGDINLTRLERKNMLQEWDYFFDTICKVFTNSTKGNFNTISSPLQYIGFAVANNISLNFGSLIWKLMLQRINQAKKSIEKEEKVLCFYPRFLMVLFNLLVPAELHGPFLDEPPAKSGKQTKRYFTGLVSSNRFRSVPVRITHHMSNFITLPIIDPQQPPIQHQPQVTTADQVLQSQPGASSSNIAASTVQTQVVRTDQGVVEPQPLTQIPDPRSTHRVIQISTTGHNSCSESS
jgi:hypothetical protein